MARLTYAPPAPSRPESIAGGVASLADIVGASFGQGMLVENTVAAEQALEDAYAARTAAIKSATGIDLGNPLVPDLSAMDPAQFRIGGMDQTAVLMPRWEQEQVGRQRQAYHDKLQALGGEYPQFSAVIKATTPLERDAEAIAFSSDEKLGRLMQSRPGWDTFAAAFIGGAGAALHDPLTLGTLFAGGGPGAARTVAGRILNVAFKEAMLNGATEAAAQPIVQDWRRRAGLPHGFDEAARNVMFAAGLGGVLGGGGRALHEVLGTMVRGKLAPRAEQAFSGDVRAQAELLSELADVMPPEVRGAIDQLEIERITSPGAEAGRRAEILQSRALFHAQNPSLSREFAEPLSIDHDQVARIVESFAPEPVAASRATEKTATGPARPMTTFVKSIGGVAPGSPLAVELNARGIDSRSAPGLFRRDGRTDLDNIPFDEVPGELRANMRPDEATTYARQQEFIDTLEAEARPDRQQGAAAIDDETEAFLLDVNSRIERVLQARPGSDDAFVREAVTMMNDEGLDLDSAIGRVEARLSGGPKAVPAAADRPTHVDLADLEARAAEGGEGDGSIDFKALEEAGFGSDVRVPWGDGSISIEALQKELEEIAWLERVVSACKVA